jgi:hypothetical protein
VEFRNDFTQTTFLQASISVRTVSFGVCGMLTTSLPRRYAAEGDANGEPISRNEEGEKILMLEREVLAYPGYVITFV